ncbi:MULTISPECIES: phosphoenolpyruvate synthase [Olivibacter]|uniref:Phosphoenolpyruvate synthase n=2 Tax=Olivibacter TaxID=376469 RepID=A0ABV6HLZ0_9SPHI|nr:phosphoenolpyruvate synthase [Olivibacter jilunii]
METNQYIIPFFKLRASDVALVGGKNASLGEMINQLQNLGVQVPAGFAIVANAYRYFLKFNQLEEKLKMVLKSLDSKELTNLEKIGKECRNLIKHAVLPDDWKQMVLASYRELAKGTKDPVTVVVRSSATSEDLPEASFAGQHDSFLNVKGEQELLIACHRCYISLFNDRAIKYRLDHGFDHMQVLLSIGVQIMVRSDRGAAGVAFTVDPETGHENIIYLTGSWGLGENVVQGAVSPDEFYLFKPAVIRQQYSLIQTKLGRKENTLILREEVSMSKSTVNVKTPIDLRERFVLDEDEAMKLAYWCYLIEQHYGMPMDIEWAKDGETNELFIVQARPETVHGRKKEVTLTTYKLQDRAVPLCSGRAVGKAIVSGRVCLVHSLADADKVKQGDIIVSDITNPDWNVLLKKAISIVTNKGGRTSHASIVARELGITAVVGTHNATEILKDGQLITVDCAQGDSGYIYDGRLRWEVKETSLEHLTKTRTAPMLILADPDRALDLSRYPNEGVGLLRMEFIINNSIQIHPMALIKYDELADKNVKHKIDSLTKHFPDKRKYFINKLSGAIAMVAAAFYPKDVIVRMSDFKSNEYAKLIGGEEFEPKEENPMLGFRGASRYYHPKYKEAFGLECQAVKRVRVEMGLDNVKVMIPFCRTVDEGKKVLEIMRGYGLVQGEKQLEIYVMAEIPSNIILAEGFASVFDGFSIGSNDLTQLTLGVDRDSADVSNLFNEKDMAVLSLLEQLIKTARAHNHKVGLCGQAPSDYPEFSDFLVRKGINSISFTADALLQGIEYIAKAEAKWYGQNEDDSYHDQTCFRS